MVSFLRTKKGREELGVKGYQEEGRVVLGALGSDSISLENVRLERNCRWVPG